MSSANGSTVGTGSAPIAPSVLPPSLRPRKPYAEKMRQVNLADYLRLMADNQRVLQITAATSQTHSQQALQLRQAQLNKALADLGQPSPPQPAPEPPMPSDEMGNILVDSPTTTNHNYPAPPAPPAPVTPPATGLSTAAKLALAGAMLGTGGAGALGAYLLNRPATPIVAPIAPPTTDPGALKITVTNPTPPGP